MLPVCQFAEPDGPAFQMSATSDSTGQIKTSVSHN